MEFEKKVVELDVNDVLPNRFQPRIKFNEDSINELSESIKEHGVIQPIVVRAMGDKYEIIAGERRYKANLLAGRQSIPAIITDLNDKDSAEVALIENVQRQDLTPIEEAISYKKILDMGYLTQEELATKLGKKQSTVANKLRLLNLAEEVQEAVLEEKISERHARSLLKLQDQQKQLEMLNKIIENRLTVRKTDEEISKLLKPEPITIDSDLVPNEDFNPFDIKPLSSLEKIDDIQKGTNEMNNEINAFMPSEPIIIKENNTKESIEPIGVSTIPTLPIEDVPMQNNDFQMPNPGFMDINKIEETAEDINISKPVADLTSLLTPVETPTTAPVEPQEEQKEMTTGKFFNLPFNEEDDSNSFDPFAPLESKQENITSVEVSTEVSSTAKPLDPVVSQDSLFNFNFDNVVSTPIQSVEGPTQQAEISNEISNILPQVDESNIVPLLPDETVNLEIAPVLPIQEEKPLNDNISSMIETPIPGEELPIPTLERAQNKNMMDAIQVVRKCSKELESLGFTIDVEEIDFESMYQVILKIKK